ncbi:MAG TPA: hypothetical protein VGM92_02975 [Candidatus Kapabacteria bacterium]|jgi:hypothetical protein
MAARSKPISFSSLLALFEQSSAEARKRIVELVEHRPKLALPHIEDVAALLESTKAPVRNASIEMLAALSRVSPTAMAFLIPALHELLSNEPQQAVANHAVEILTNYARTSKEAAQKVIPILQKNVRMWNPKLTLRVKDALKELK